MKKKSLALILSLAVASLFAAASAFAYGGEAVIVYNPSTGGYGSYHGVPDYADAYNDAQSLCPGNCSVTTFVHNGWIALAVSSVRNGNNAPAAFGTGGLHDSEYDAEQSALNNCENGAQNQGIAYGSCYVLRSLSSFDYGPDYNGVQNN